MLSVGSELIMEIRDDHDPEARMIQRFIKNWWLLALCGVLEAILSAISFSMQDPEGYLALGIRSPEALVKIMCMLALAAGASTLAAGIGSSARGMSWLLVLNG